MSQYTTPTSSSVAKPRFGSPQDFKRAISELKTTFKDRGDDIVSTDPDDLLAHGYTMMDVFPPLPHSVVIYPESTEDVVLVVKIATKFRMPIVPYSGGTGLEGHSRSHVSGGICVDLSRMNKIINIHEADSDVVCQPGLGWMELNQTLKEKGIPLFFPLDPAPSATVGGMLSTGCSGTNAVRYGTAKAEWFLNATVVLPSGKVIKTRQRSRKSSAGFDTTKLFIGAEGTLGIVTELTLRLAPVLPTNVAVVQFQDVKAATEAATDLLNHGIGLQCVELVDDDFMHATNLYGQSSRRWAEKDSLFLKFQGPSTASLAESAKVARQVTARHGALSFELANNQQDAEDLWNDRKNGAFITMALVPGCRAMATDVCVPVSKLPDLVYETKKDLAECGLKSAILGHAGDGNFHAGILFSNDEERICAQEVADRMVRRAIALDGTCTGEHGVGMGKKRYLVEELGEGTVELMKTLKRAVDPLGLFNPGKV
ncbi:FAD-linked oxidase-like protein [Mucidula mucida]|nr:FAD-linked oxidase-like protein [Mucidula mucida]